MKISVDETSPPLPENAHIIRLVYDFAPSGATFHPSLSVIWRYDESDIPEAVAEEDLVIAYYDNQADEWVSLDCAVDSENNVITAAIPHLTTSAIISAIIPFAANRRSYRQLGSHHSC